LRRAGLEVGTTARLPYPNAAEGTVIAQDPPAHAQDIAQPTINLLVVAPDDEIPDGYVMPDLVGMPIVSAETALTKVGIKAATPMYVSVPVGPIGTGDAPPILPVKPGSVTAQTPAAGARVDQNTMVNLTVAK
jgi:beta-lactam-binding protein with PASTA domain